MCRAFNYWIKCPRDLQKIYGEIGGTVYNVGAIMDDVEDNAVLRRGIRSAHLVYGSPLTIQGVIFKAILLLEHMLQHLHNRTEQATDLFIKLGIEVCTGQGIEMYFTDNCICPAFKDYEALVNGRDEHHRTAVSRPENCRLGNGVLVKKEWCHWTAVSQPEFVELEGWHRVKRNRHHRTAVSRSEKLWTCK
ncbi:hypothetical protein Zmor_023288 [Zophobas morio]|uniref:Uncharacterized protein n=1 Tax=Zophobas morio TaxID=2755281 RepID=A0AA38HZ58_9CUCU|nr:hypothetical protein Zmor_023288 [Zophobas morio]